MGGFFGGLAAAAGGVAPVLAAANQQQRQIQATKNIQMLNLWSQQRDKIADMLTSQMNLTGGQDRANLAGLLNKVLTLKPGQDPAPLLQSIQDHTTVHPTAVQALTPQQGPPPPAGAVPVGQVPGSGGSAAAPAAQPGTNPVQPSGGIQPIPTGGNDLDQALNGGAPAPAPIQAINAPGGPPAFGGYPTLPEDQAALDLEKQYLSGPNPYVPPWLDARLKDIRQRRAQFAEEIAKPDVLRQQREGYLKNEFSGQEFPPEEKAAFLNTGQFKDYPALKPGEVLPGISGKPLAQGNPLTEIVPEGATAIRISPPGSASPGAPDAGQLSQVLATVPPRLNTQESIAISSALQTAQKYGVPFDPKVNPRDPLSQLPPQYQTEAAQLAKQMNEDPELRAMHLAIGGLTEAMKTIQLGQMPTQDQADDVAKLVINHQLAPEQVSTMFSGLGGAAFKRMVGMAAIKQDPNFDFEQASSDYHFGRSAGFQNAVRYMDAVAQSIPRLIDSADKLGNTSIKTINLLVNRGKSEFNNVDLKRFMADRVLVGDEIAKIIQGGTGNGTSDAKLQQAQDLLSSTDSPQAISTALKEVQGLIGNRRQALTKGTYLEKRAIQGISPQKVNTQAEYDAVPKGSQYIDVQDGKTYTKK
jgi:hypothetical protein